jgi:hypothetical protein
MLTCQSERLGAGRWLFTGEAEGDLMHYQEFFACLAEARNAGFTPYLSDVGEVRLALPSKEGICDPINAVCAMKTGRLYSHPLNAATKLGMTRSLYEDIMEASRNDLLLLPRTRKTLLEALGLQEPPHPFRKRFHRLLKKALVLR